MRRVLSLDLDGVLTTQHSRTYGPTTFSRVATAALNHVLTTTPPDLVVIHSTWRKLPEPPPGPYQVNNSWWFWSMDWFVGHCRNQACVLATLPMIEAPWRLSSNRGQEVGMARTDWHQPGDRWVVIDDECDYFVDHPYAEDPDVLIVPTRDDRGLTMEQAGTVCAWWSSHD